MTVRFRIPGYLRPFAEGRPEVALPGPFANVGEALKSLGAQFPGVRDRVLMETGEVRPHVNVFVGEESIRYTGGLATPLVDGATVFIVPAISGGAGLAVTIFEPAPCTRGRRWRPRSSPAPRAPRRRSPTDS